MQRLAALAAGTRPQGLKALLMNGLLAARLNLRFAALARALG